MPPEGTPNQENAMKLRRKPVSKQKSAKKFRRQVSRTKAINVMPMRGGYRL